jgi:hypothetical protein
MKADVFYSNTLDMSSHLQDKHYEIRSCPFQHLHQVSSWATFPGNAHFRHFQSEVSKRILQDAHLHRNSSEMDLNVGI